MSTLKTERIQFVFEGMRSCLRIGKASNLKNISVNARLKRIGFAPFPFKRQSCLKKALDLARVEFIYKAWSIWNSFALRGNVFAFHLDSINIYEKMNKLFVYWKRIFSPLANSKIAAVWKIFKNLSEESSIATTWFVGNRISPGEHHLTI